MDPIKGQEHLQTRSHSSSRESSTSSAIDLSNTSSGIANSISNPSSPSGALTPREGSRRRLSWGGMAREAVDVDADPLRLNLQSRESNSVPEDPFVDDSDTPRDEQNVYTFDRVHQSPYSMSTAASLNSQASLMYAFRQKSATDSNDSVDDDEARLTSFASQPGGANRSGAFSDRSGTGHDLEHIMESTPKSRLSVKRKSKRYSATPSPVSRLKSVSRNLRRVSLRVVNFAGVSLEDHGRSIRLPDDALDPLQNDPPKQPEEEEDEEFEELPDLQRRLPIRGRTLGFLGPNSRLRLALYRFLIYPWTEPIILLLIIANAIILTIQAARSLTIPDSSSPVTPTSSRGYFHQWEDYALFVIFILFTVEMFARIVTSGLFLDPEIPLSLLFSNPFRTPPPASRPAMARDSHGDSSLHLSTSVSSGLSRHDSQRGKADSDTMGFRLRDFLRQLQFNLFRPFVLAHHEQWQATAPPPDMQRNHSSSNSLPESARSDTAFIEEKIHSRGRLIPHLRDPSKPTFFARALRTDGGIGIGSGGEPLSLPFKLSVSTSHSLVRRNVPYLRHSWNRIDCVAVVSFWITFALACAGIEQGVTRHIGIFRALSVLRTTRLLAVTAGTTTIMRSLKRARPLLTNVAYFVLFAMVLFSIIGVQSFAGSLRRACWLSPTQGQPAIQISSQLCGGYIDPATLNVTGYIFSDGTISSTAKGYICPLGQICQETSNPYSDIESFDTIYFAALQVVIVAGANGWAPLMYDMVDSEYFISCVYFIVCIIILNFWLINLFIAVITNTFSAIRSNTKRSAFGAAPLGPILNDEDDYDALNGRQLSRPSTLKRWYDRTKFIWVLFALSSVVLQATRSADSSPAHLQLLTDGELTLTLLFDIDIIWRFLSYLPSWRTFFNHGNNWLDLILALASSIIQIPAVRNSDAYPWLTIFQLTRFYRVILEIPRMRPLLLSVFGNLYGLVNMSLFLILANYIAALVAVQLFRGDLSVDDTMNFGGIYNSFLAMYQVLSSENWTNVLYTTAQAEIFFGQSALTTLFVTAWFLFANFILVQLFIAVINENFDVAEELKKQKQTSHYLAMQQPVKSSPEWLMRLNPYRWFKATPKSIAVENLPSSLVLPMQKSMMQDQMMSLSDGLYKSAGTKKASLPRHYSNKSINLLNSLFTGENRSELVPLATLRAARRPSTSDMKEIKQDEDEIQRHLDILAVVSGDMDENQEFDDWLYERKAQKADFIRAHPTYDKTFWIFSQSNPVRQFCQRLVQPAGGERIFGVPHSPVAHALFQLFLLLTVIAGIVVEAIATPVYRRNFYAEHGVIRGSWFDIVEGIFGFILFIEFVIKLIADGFTFTPNAYIRSIWNILDLAILIGLSVNLITGVIFVGGLSRLTRALKAFRALRLISLIDRMRITFQSLIFAGAIRILDAALLAILYMIPYAVWGLNIFEGQLNECNDGSVNGLSDCNDEYTNTVLGDSFGFLVPRVWSNPSPSTTFSFDSFRSSLLILFEIVSLEGWVDVMGVATSATGRNLQPQTNASQANAIFFLIYILLGALIILTLFVSIIIANFSSKTGIALLTQPQREWIDLQKLITRQRPSKRPKVKPTWPLRAWCFDRAVQKHGYWSRMMTCFFVLHVFVLMTQTFSSSNSLNEWRDSFFDFITAIYILDICVRWFGLGFRSFKANGWNIFDVIVALGALVTSLAYHAQFSDPSIAQLQKLFLVSIAFKLIQRTNSLNQLFKTALASLPVIISLLALWFILFLFFALLFVEVFSLTKWNSAETRSQNYSSLSHALVMLAFMSTGEGWNQYMHDYTISFPRCTNSSAADYSSDCGSTGWALTLFIAWNLLSMYIFVNMFTGVVVESFSYVFQLSGGAKLITREEMRAFKKVWAEFANQRTGYLEKERLVAFLARLSGVFEIKIFPTEYRVKSLMTVAPSTFGHLRTPKHPNGLDVYRLSKMLDSVDFASIRKRRTTYSRLYHEALLTQEPGKGISFTQMLLLLAHHKLIDDREALGLKDLVTRTRLNQIVNDLVNVDRVKSLLKTIYLRRRYLKERSMRLSRDLDIPAIVVDDMPTTPSLSTRDITLAGRESPSQFGDLPTRSPSPSFQSPDLSWKSGTLPSRTGRLRRDRRSRSDFGSVSADLGQYASELSFSRDLNDGGFEDTDHVLSSMQNSMWGEMMLEAAEEER